MTLLIILLQITTTTSETPGVVTPAAPAAEESMNILDLLVKGGWVMIPIFILSFLAIYIMIERYITIKKASRDTGDLMDRVKSYILQGDIKSAKALCDKNDSPIAKMIGKGVMRLGMPLKDIESSIENTGKIEIYKLEKNVSVLGIIAGIAPMLGFVGTIIGVIKIFYNIALADNISIGLIAGGLYQKMITSASGLIVGIIAHIGFHYLTLMIDRVVFKMESSAVDFIDLLQENK